MNIIQIDSNIDTSIIEYLSYNYEGKIDDNHIYFLQILKCVKTGFKNKYESFIISNYEFDINFINKLQEYIKNVDFIVIIDINNIPIGYALNRKTGVYILNNYDLLFKDIINQICVHSLYKDLHYITLQY